MGSLETFQETTENFQKILRRYMEFHRRFLMLRKVSGACLIDFRGVSELIQACSHGQRRRVVWPKSTTHTNS